MPVRVKNLWKTFKIPKERRDTLFENLTGIFCPNQYDVLTVLKDINFAADKGDFIGIIGDNGSGKSTLLKIIANILRPTKGEIEVEGKIASFLELGVGFHPDLTVLENVDVYASVIGLSNHEIEDRKEDIIEFAGLRKFEETKLKNLSSGMQVRLAFSTAIQNDPEILLVDEVLAVGDKEFQQKCFEIFDRYKREGVTTLFVSHDLGSVRRFCDKTLLLRHGEQVAFDETSRVVDKYIYNSDDLLVAELEIANNEPNEDRKSRWGSGQIEITGVKFLDKRGLERSDFVSGDPMTVRIYYYSHETMHSPVFGIIFYTQDAYCYGTNTKLKEYCVGPVSGKGYIDLVIDKLPLLGSNFEVTVAITDSLYTTTYDWHDRMYSFNVHNPTRDLGILTVDCRWRAMRDV
jgi:lipopolysaccharide transport system ATP-binding protein